MPALEEMSPDASLRTKSACQEAPPCGMLGPTTQGSLARFPTTQTNRPREQNKSRRSPPPPRRTESVCLRRHCKWGSGWMEQANMKSNNGQQWRDNDTCEKPSRARQAQLAMIYKRTQSWSRAPGLVVSLVNRMQRLTVTRWGEQGVHPMPAESHREMGGNSHKQGISKQTHGEQDGGPEGWPIHCELQSTEAPPQSGGKQLSCATSFRADMATCLPLQPEQ